MVAAFIWNFINSMNSAALFVKNGLDFLALEFGVPLECSASGAPFRFNTKTRRHKDFGLLYSLHPSRGYCKECLCVSVVKKRISPVAGYFSSLDCRVAVLIAGMGEGRIEEKALGLHPLVGIAAEAWLKENGKQI